MGSVSTLGLLLYLAIRIAGDCPTPPVYQDRTHSNYDASYSTGDQATYQCAPGYYYISGQRISTCQSDGSWSQVTLSCELGSCSNPGTPQYGTRSGDDFRVGKQVRYSCNEGYRLQGTTVSTCLTDSTWSSGATSCHAITCPSLQAPPDSSINPAGEGRYDTIVTVTCNQRGYMYSETPNTRRCKEDGTWTGTAGTCTETDCGLPTLYNGEVEAPVGTGYAAEIRYKCNDGSTMDMSQELKNSDGYSTCYDTGKWIPLPPTCNVNCGRDVPDVTHGSISHTGSTSYPHSTVLNINCNSGFTRQGADHVTCNNGTWTPNVDLTCVAVPTPEPTKAPEPTTTPVPTPKPTKAAEPTVTKTKDQDQTDTPETDGSDHLPKVLGGLAAAVIVIGIIFVIFWKRNVIKQKFTGKGKASIQSEKENVENRSDDCIKLNASGEKTESKSSSQLQETEPLSSAV